MTTVTVPAGKKLDPEIDRLFREHSRLVYRTAYGITRDYGDADDVLQSIFLKLLQSGLSENLKRNPAGYLHRAAINQSLNILRSKERRRETQKVDALQFAEQSSNNESAAEEQRHRQLLDALSNLKPQAIDMLMLHYKHDYSDAQIAKMLGKSRGTVAVTLYRIRARLRGLLRGAALKESNDEIR
jgi:RNA polymerase sigma-70 factor, ECF subfamily